LKSIQKPIYGTIWTPKKAYERAEKSVKFTSLQMIFRITAELKKAFDASGKGGNSVATTPGNEERKL